MKSKGLTWLLYVSIIFICCFNIKIYASPQQESTFLFQKSTSSASLKSSHSKKLKRTASRVNRSGSTVNYIDYFHLELSSPLNRDASVHYKTRDGTAREGIDYSATSGIATIPAGQSSIDIGVDILIAGTGKTFSLVITNPVGGKFPVGVTEIVVEHTVPPLIVSPKINISSIRGNTTSYNTIAEFDVSLNTQPSSDVFIPISSSNENEGVPTITSLTFTSDNWNQAQTVVVKGRNQNIENGIQDYKIILAAAQSSDTNYNGLDPDDVAMKGIFLTLSEPNDSLSLISGLEATISANVTYTGNERLSFSLEEKPDGMTIDLNLGLIKWTPVESTEGNTYPVKVKVTDGILFSETSFSVVVADASPLQTQISGNIVSVIKEGSNLKGLSIQLIDSSLNTSDIILNTLPDTNMLAIPNNIQRNTDFFMIKTPVSGKLKIKLPLAQLPANTDLQQVNLYSLVESDDIEGKFWSPVGIDIDIFEVQGESIVEITLLGLEGIFFIGIESASSTENSIRQRKILGQNLFSRTPVSVVTCTSETKSDGSINYNKQTCTIASNNDVEIKVLGFGSTITATRWGGTTIKELITWLVDAQEGFKGLGMKYDDKFTVRIHSMPKPSYLGYVTSGNNENRKTLHLTSANKAQNTMYGTSVHEYFHHSQSRSNIKNRSLLINSGRQASWFIEGSARWFEDKLLDDLNTYLNKEGSGSKIMEVGLNRNATKYFTTKSYAGKEKERPYQRFSFFKLLSQKCTTFDDTFNKLLNIDRSTDVTGIKNLKTELGNSNCNFGSHLDSEKTSSLEAALLYYQYATLYKNKISLLDSNEADAAFKFKPTIHSYEKSDWFDVGEVKSAKVSQITNIPAYGAYSIQIKGDMWNDIEEGKEAVLRVKVQAGSPALIVSLLSEDASFRGNTLLDGIQHRHYKTSEISEYIFSQDELVPFFITLVNPNSSDVSISEITFEIRDKLSPELEVTSPTDNSDVNNRVISVTGNVPDTATNVDRVIISNGDIKTVTTVGSNKSFAADVVVTMGNNTLIVQGYNASDLTKPLTKEKIVNVTGVENTAGGRNALIPSRIAVVLRWKTNGTDIDIYSTDKNSGTIWYRNKSVLPGILDSDNTSGYGPEVISYRKTDDAVYVDGQFDIDVHFFSGSTPTTYSLDVIMNETDASNVRVRHYESKVSLPSGNSGENSPSGSGNSRFNNVLSVKCNPQRICSIKTYDSSKLTNETTVVQTRARQQITNHKATAPQVKYRYKTSYDKCIAEYNSSIQKAGTVDWSCNKETGAKIWH